MKNIYNKIDKRLMRTKRRTYSLYNNILAGIITGTIFGSFIPNYFNAPQAWLINSIWIIIFVLIGYNGGKWAIGVVTKDNSELSNYRSNFLAGLFASLYASIMILVSLKTRMFVLVPIFVILLVLTLVFWSRIRKK